MRARAARRDWPDVGSPGSRPRSFCTCQVLRPRRAVRTLRWCVRNVLPSALETASAPGFKLRTARDAREVFAQACARAGIPMLSANDEPGSPLAASWREAEGSYVEIAVQRAAAFDLVVAASATVMESLMAIAEQSLLQTRRPVVLAPARLQSDLTDSVMIAWDESPECWHAVSAAIPFMHLAKSVRVVSVDRDASNRQASQAEVLAYLRSWRRCDRE